MKKYIDADLLKAEFTGNFACEYPAPLVKALIDNQPAADVAEVVRCKDYKYWDNTDVDYKGNPIKTYAGECQCSQWENEYYRYATTGNDFCSYGEKAAKE